MSDKCLKRQAVALDLHVEVAVAINVNDVVALALVVVDDKVHSTGVEDGVELLGGGLRGRARDGRGHRLENSRHCEWDDVR